MSDSAVLLIGKDSFYLLAFTVGFINSNTSSRFLRLCLCRELSLLQLLSDNNVYCHRTTASSTCLRTTVNNQFCFSAHFAKVFVSLLHVLPKELRKWDRHFFYSIKLSQQLRGDPHTSAFNESASVKRATQQQVC